MTVGKGTGYLTGQVILQIPVLDPNEIVAIPFKGVTVTLIDRDGRHDFVTDEEGRFLFDGLTPGHYRVCVDQTITRDDGAQFQLLAEDQCQWVELAEGDQLEQDVGAIVFSIESLDQTSLTAMRRLAGIEDAAKQVSSGLDDIDKAAEKISNDVNTLTNTATGAVLNVKNHKDLIISTAQSIEGIESALKDMTTYPFSGPSDTESGAQPPRRSSQTTRGSSSGVRFGVQSALESLGVSGELTDEELARLFPAEAGDNGEVNYRWAGPVVTMRSATQANGRTPGTVQVSGALARFQQRAQAALAEIKEVLATLQPLSGHDVDPQALATQKKIVLQTMQSIADEPSRPEGLRQLAVDLQFNSLLDDKVRVERYRPPVNGNFGVLEYMLGISNILITDQDTELKLTDWNRVNDAALSAREAWNTYKATTTTTPMQFGEGLQELYGLFGALSESVVDARSMLRTVRYTPQEEATQKFPTRTGEVTIDDLLSMVEELATDIGPTYVTDWKGRGVATLAGRAKRLATTVDDVINSKTFPFTSSRVSTAFGDLARLLKATANESDILAGNKPKPAPTGAGSTP